MTAVAQAVAAATIAVAREGIGQGRIRARIAAFVALERTDAMGPGVIAGDSDASGSALACLQQQPVVARVAATLDFNEVAHVLAGLLRINERKSPPRIRVGGGRADGAWGRRPRRCECSYRVALCETVRIGVGVTREVARGIQLLRTQHMDRMTTQIVCGHEPVVCKLALDGQVPVLHLGRMDITHRGETPKRDERRVGTEPHGEWVAAGYCPPRVVEAGIDQRGT